jgi:hypothetical protein
MTDRPANARTGSGNDSPRMQDQPHRAAIKQALLKDIRVKWGKFTEQELARLRNNDDLVRHVVAKYGLDEAHAQRAVDALRAGRNI